MLPAVDTAPRWYARRQPPVAITPAGLRWCSAVLASVESEALGSMAAAEHSAGVRRNAHRSAQRSGVNSRAAMWFGRGLGAANGSTRALETLLKTKNALRRSNGVMLPLEPCIVFESKNVTDPAGPITSRISPRSA